MNKTWTISETGVYACVSSPTASFGFIVIGDNPVDIFMIFKYYRKKFKPITVLSVNWSLLLSERTR